MLSIELVKSIAHLARLEFNSETLGDLQQDLSNIMQMVESIQTIETQHCEAMNHPFDLYQKLRSDKAEAIEDQAVLAQLAPLLKDNLYLVPKVIE